MTYLFWAYTITWVVLFGYTISIGLRQNRLAAEVEVLKQAVESKARK